MYLIDTNVVSEARKGDRTNAGVRTFFAEVQHTEPTSICPRSPSANCAVARP